jgi:predicted kinase
MLILLSGLPGTGKSTIADGIARARRLPVFSVDSIESAIIEAGVAASFETGLAAYLVARTLADQSLVSVSIR